MLSTIKLCIFSESGSCLGELQLSGCLLGKGSWLIGESGGMLINHKSQIPKSGALKSLLYKIFVLTEISSLRKQVIYLPLNFWSD